jgi:putative phosphoribosyl transferase
VGSLLADRLGAYAGSDALVLGLSRGGVVPGDALARALGLPFDVLVVHKILEPAERHVGLGVVAEPGHVVVHHHRLAALALASAWLDEALARAIEDVQRRGAAYRGGRQRAPLAGRAVILVDDSAGTGASLRAAVMAARSAGAREVVVAIPVAPLRVIEALQQMAERVVYLTTPAHLIWRDMHYPMRGEVDDDDIARLLERWA